MIKGIKKVDQVSYLSPWKINGVPTNLMKKGYLIKWGNMYFLINRQYNHDGTQLREWEVCEYYTGMKVSNGHSGMRTAMASLAYKIKQKDLEKTVKIVLDTRHRRGEEDLNKNPESYTWDIIDLKEVMG